MRHLDYDQIAPTYNRRFAEGKREGTDDVLAELAQRTPGGRILEAGCGTGHWLAGLRQVSQQLYGLDLSAGMLAQAQQSDEHLHLARGQAGRLPFDGSSFDLVFCVNAIHHFTSQREFVMEAGRVLRPGGAFAVIGMDPRGHRDDWYIYEYFEGTFQVDLERFPSWETIQGWMVQAGFQRPALRPVERIIHHKVGRSVLDDPYLEKSASSQLALLSEEAYATGLARIRKMLDGAGQDGEYIIFPVAIYIDMLVGYK